MAKLPRSLFENKRHSAPKTLNQWLQQLESNHNKKIDLGLERVGKVFQQLGLEKIAKTIITVAGTNGKGSTIAILSSICQQAAYKVGAFTSPHLLHYNERIQINDKNVSDDDIIAAFELIEDNLGSITLSYFEYSTLAALIIFKQKNVDIALLEVGLGGRLDSVNIVDTDCAVITTIDIDHTQWLGKDKESIGREKAGIMRANTPAVYGDSDCPRSIVAYAAKIKAQLTMVPQLKTKYDLNLIGDYQQKNAHTALTVLQQLSESLKISKKHISDGLKQVKLSGRLQTIASDPQIIVDVSHNKQAANSLAHWLKNNPIDGTSWAVFAVLDDKEAIEWLPFFSELIDAWCISEVVTTRTMPVKTVLACLADSARLVTSFNTVSHALQAAKTMAQKNDRILVFGSFYTVSEALESILKTEKH